MTALDRLRDRRAGGPLLMAGGLGIVGIAGYGFLAFAGHTLRPADYAAVSAFYLVVNIVGPGLFAALEQETNRATSSALPDRRAAALVGRTAAKLGGGLLVIALVILLAGSPVLVGRVFSGQWSLEVALLVGAVAAYCGYLARGVLGGRQQFHGYAATLATEGLSRIIPVAIVAALGMTSTWSYGIFFAIGLGCAGGVGWLFLRAKQRAVHVTSTAEERSTLTSTIRSGLMLLVGALLLTQLVANLAPIVVTSRLVTDAATAAAFTSAFVLVRVPLFLFSPIQALLLPGLTRAITEGDHVRFRRNVRIVVGLVFVVGAVGAVLSALVGPWVVRVFFGAQVRLPGTLLGVLGISTLLLMVAQVLQPALIAGRRHRFVTAGWSLGAAALVALLFLPVYPVTAAVIAQVVGSALVVVTMAIGMAGLWRPAAARPRPSGEGARQPS